MQIRTIRAPTSIAIGQGLSPAKTLDTGDFNVAYNICMAYRTKNTLLRTEMNGRKFFYDLDHQDCLAQKFATSINAILMVSGENEPMILQSDVSKFLKTIQTHQHGLLAPICDEILKGTMPSNTVVLDANTKVQFEFFGSNTPVYSYTVTTAVANPNVAGEFVVVKEDTVSVALSKTSDNEIVGMDRSHQQTVPCPNGANEIFTQKFLH